MSMDPVENLLEFLSSAEFTDLTLYSNDFDLFKLMGISSKELVHSNLIAGFLRENEPHGLGTAFRDAYVHSLANCKFMNASIPIGVFERAAGLRARVARESSNLDVLIDFTTVGLVIAIENKIWAADQTDQVSRYQAMLCKLYPQYPHRMVVYLTPNGRRSRTADPKSEVPVYQQSYAQLAQLLREQRVNAVPAASEFMRQLVTHLEKTMAGTSELKDLCWKAFQDNEDAYENLVKHYDYCVKRKLDQIFAQLEAQILGSESFAAWSGKIECRLTRHSKKEKRKYDLDVRLADWPAGLIVKIYKHSWFGVIPCFPASQIQEIERVLPGFASPTRPVPDFPGYFLASPTYHQKHERCITERGEKVTEDDLHHALNKLHSCIYDIESALETSPHRAAQVHQATSVS